MTIASFISMLVACHEWAYLFAIGTSIPPISGIIISCLDNNLRGDGFSFCNLILNLLGSFPSSYVLKESNDENTNTENKEKENKDEEQKENI